MKLRECELEIDFTDAVAGMKFDDASHKLSHCMKAVDFIVELEEGYLFVEIKDPSNSNSTAERVEKFKEKSKSGKLCKDLVQKFRDTFVYRWAEKELTKPIHFVSLVTLEDPLLTPLQDDLQKQLPFLKTDRWKRNIVQSCLVMNENRWNKNFPKWPLTRIAENGS